MSEVHSVSAIVLSKVSGASACGMSSCCVGLLGTHQHIFAMSYHAIILTFFFTILALSLP